MGIALQRLGRLAALPASHRRTLMAAAALVPLAALALKCFGVARWQQGFRAAAGAADPAQIQLARETAVLVEVAARYNVFPSTCLSRSLALHWLLRHHGIAHALRIGVSRHDDALQAHAWVECGGEPVNDTPEAVAAFSALQTTA